MVKIVLGLRAQLLSGLVLIMLVATLSVGTITVWATGQQLDDNQRQISRWLGQAVARSLRDHLLPEPDLARLAAVFDRPVAPAERSATALQALEVFGARQQSLFRQGRLTGPLVFVRQAARERQQVVEVVAGPRLEIDTPVMAGDGRLLGVVRMQLALASETARWPVLFWVLMVLDSLMLVLFVGVVLTRYVARPVEALQRAAARVSGGDLQGELDEAVGARELSSLAQSFNRMTAAIRDQLARIEDQRRSLIRSEKLASVGRLAAGVAHEIGNPMQAIIGFADLLRNTDLAAETREDYLRRIHDEAERIHRIIGDLLEFSRPGQEGVEPVQLALVVEQAIGLVRPQKRFRQVSASIDLAGLQALPQVAASTQRLVQVLVNLLLNAADAVQGQGVVEVRPVPANEAEGLVGLEITDDGPSIPDEVRDAIFDPFFTTKPPGQGAGLGLSVSRSIVDGFDGQLTLLEGERTAFRLLLPPWPADGADRPPGGASLSQGKHGISAR